MAPFEALDGQKCRSPIGWLEVGERKLLRTKMVQATVEGVQIIRERMLASQSRQKSYSDNRRKPLEFEKGKLSPRYIGPFEILERIGAVAYRLALPLDFEGVNLVFHVSMLRKYVRDPSHVIQHDTILLEDRLKYQEQPVAIVDYQVKRLRSKDIALMKVVWQNNSIENET
ncbi:PREDICTED: uncharacterized protein LOC108661947 [Theobroma cacao]|uniref:Uncharacterized protein LOC108661947 n=1 Tax=Theobroma cacao TaxID=3641 RepID=A0AB32WEP6_THECC|nr:PREDICTED: uncharacterized protein LOC108661947 [Theobroma cacao]